MPFTRNPKAVSAILKGDAAKTITRAVADRLAADMDDPEVFVEEYETDRAVAGVMVPADKQARNGLATRALGRTSGG